MYILVCNIQVHYERKELLFPLQSQNYTSSYCFKFEISTTLQIQMAIFKIMISFFLVYGEKRCKEPYCLHHQCIRQTEYQCNCNLHFIVQQTQATDSLMTSYEFHMQHNFSCDCVFVRFFSFVFQSRFVSPKVIGTANSTTETSVRLWAEDGFQELWSTNYLITTFLCVSQSGQFYCSHCLLLRTLTLVHRHSVIHPTGIAELWKLANYNYASDGTCTEEQQQWVIYKNLIEF